MNTLKHTEGESPVTEPQSPPQFIVFEDMGEDPPATTDARLLRLATIRSHDQYNTTIYSLDDRYRGVFGGRRVVFMNAADMEQRGIGAGALVEMETLSEDGRKRMVRNFTAHPYDIPLGCIAAYYPETNPLLPLGFHDPKSKTPAAKSIPVLVRAQEAPRRHE
jgi:anaerobic selenocysteine-containing dehydrogenase